MYQEEIQKGRKSYRLDKERFGKRISPVHLGTLQKIRGSSIT